MTLATGTVYTWTCTQLIPPAQRILLEPPTIADALDYPQGFAKATLGYEKGSEPQSLRDILLRLPLKLESAPKVRSFFDLLVCRFGVRDDSSLSSSPYFGAQILRPPPRNLADLYAALREVERGERHAQKERVTRDPKHSALIDLLGRETLAAIAEDESTPMQASRVVEELIRSSESDEWLAHAAELRFKPVTRTAIFATPRESLGGTSGELQANLHAGWTLERESQSSPLRVEHGEVQSSPRVRALLAVLSDVLSDAPTPFLRSYRLVPRADALNLPRVSWSPPGGARSVAVLWPIPSHRTIWELDLLFDVWNSALRKAQSLEADSRVDFLAKAWFHSTTTLLLRDRWTEFKPLEQDEESDQRVKSLMKALLDAALGPGGDQRAKTWLGLVLAFLAPEGGASKDVADLLIDTATLEKAQVESDLDLWNQVVNTRQRAAVRFLEGGLRDALCAAGAIPWSELRRAIPPNLREIPPGRDELADVLRRVRDAQSDTKPLAANSEVERVRDILCGPQCDAWPSKVREAVNWELCVEAAQHPINKLAGGTLRPFI